MSKIFTLICFFLLSYSVVAQDTLMEKSPKQYSFTLGYRNTISSSFVNNASNGYNLEAEIAWKVSGFHKKSAVYFGVPLGYNYSIPNTENDFYSTTLFYGWIVRHEIGRNKKYTPFLGYGLLLNQLRIDGTEGSVFGHQTRFEFGVNRHLKNKTYIFAKIEYSYARFPSLGNSSSNKTQFIGFKLGLRI
ncbi:MAG: hypothetical protein L3J74_09240 [Bacteroidales bacterium]|nr:hypothetical protein [Bacteroidales bacterium]